MPVAAQQQPRARERREHRRHRLDQEALTLLLGEPSDREDRRISGVVERRGGLALGFGPEAIELLASQHDVDLRRVPRAAADRIRADRVADGNEPIDPSPPGELVHLRDDPSPARDGRRELAVAEPSRLDVRDVRDDLHARAPAGGAPDDRRPQHLRVDRVEAPLTKQAGHRRNRFQRSGSWASMQPMDRDACGLDLAREGVGLPQERDLRRDLRSIEVPRCQGEPVLGAAHPQAVDEVEDAMGHGGRESSTEHSLLGLARWRLCRSLSWSPAAARGRPVSEPCWNATHRWRSRRSPIFRCLSTNGTVVRHPWTSPRSRSISPRTSASGIGGLDAATTRAALEGAVDYPAAMRALYEAYASARGKTRYGDKTPPFVLHMDLACPALPGIAVRPRDPRRTRRGDVARRNRVRAGPDHASR